MQTMDEDELEKLAEPSFISSIRPTELANDDREVGTSEAPHYSIATSVLPKSPLQGYVLASEEEVRNVFTPSTFNGIRSLPNALSPDFRNKLFEHMAAAGRAQSACSMRSPSPTCTRLSTGEHASSSGRHADGSRSPQRFHPLQGSFSVFDHASSDYETEALLHRFERLSHKLAQTGADFVVRGASPGPKHTPAFSEFTYEESPFELEEQQHRAEARTKAKAQHGPFYPGGRSSAVVVLKGQAAECVQQLTRQLQRDWPASFLQVFEDKTGAIVASFDVERASKEGDVTGYMHQLVKVDHITNIYRLAKDATKWAYTEAGSPSLFYVMWPAWTPHRTQLPEELAGHVPQHSRPVIELFPPKRSTRTPFAQLTDSGLTITTTTRLYQRTMKT